MPDPGKLLAIDYGRARLGLAVCDALRISIKALGHINRETDKQAAGIVHKLATDEQVVSVVIGLPLHASGDVGENVEWVRNFCTELAQLNDLPIIEVDERHSSQEAEALLKEEGKWPAEPGAIDAKAACVILKRYIDGET